MSWINDLLKEIPLSTVLKERVALIEEKFKLAETENSKLRQQNDALAAENKTLKQQLVTLGIEKQFVEMRGVLWLRDAGGEFLPYCPVCKIALTGTPPHSPDSLRCSKCKFTAPFHPNEAKDIAQSMGA